MKKSDLEIYHITLLPEKDSDIFFDEYNIISKTIDSVNSLNLIYKTVRANAKGGPSTHQQQDLYRAMLIFACAGLDVFLKQLIKNKLPQLIGADKDAEDRFKEYVMKGMKGDPDKILNIIALALIDNTPRNIFLNKYIDKLTGNSLQSSEELCTISNASGLDTKKILNSSKITTLKEIFTARNQIIHEMDINIGDKVSRTTGYRTRRQRTFPKMAEYTKFIINLAEDIFTAYKEKFEKYKIEAKKTPEIKPPLKSQKKISKK